MKVFHRAAVLCAMMAVGAPVWAQQNPDAPRQADPAKPQVQTFEMVLRTAVETGGRNFATRAAQMSPDIAALSFSPGESPVVSGIADHQLGLFVFQVQVPGVALTLQVMNMMLNRGPVLVASDPMGPAPATRPDLEREYRTQVRDALIEAILDNSGGLPLAASDTLLVYAGGIDPAVPNSLLRVPTSKLVIKAKGSDLSAFRQGQINREEARRRVQVSSF